ncbi:tetraacyldisaccharide 4'-kinase [Bdellovibrio sp. qaytius]|nr:tetraacyldisaccharide 4'-kinase [Bdellovibrio sp. qaytius]
MKYLNPYRLVISAKNLMYENGWLKPEKFSVPVISVGNLTTGGTGKTPVVLELISLLQDKSILVVSKSYKASLPEPAEVTLENLKHTGIYGDEPCLIKKLAPHVSVWSGPHKTDTVEIALERLASKKHKIDIVIVDDAFSHRMLKRDLDIVLIDVSQPLSHYQLIPFGHLREDIDQVLRAHLVILTKVNNAQAETLNFFREYLVKNKKTTLESIAKSIVNSENKKLFLYSGIGNPSQLKLNLENSGFQVVEHLVYPDHHSYSLSEQSEILTQWRSKFSDSVLCATEKDLVKVTDTDLKSQTKPIALQLDFSNIDKDLLNAKLRQISQ